MLALDSATGGACSVTIMQGDALRATRHQSLERGHAALLPVQLAECLTEACVTAGNLDLIAVTVGPGSFTGIRSAVALAQGLALAAGIPAIGVTVGEAIAESLSPLAGRSLWVVSPSRRGRVFLEADGQCCSVAVTDLPALAGPAAVAGPAALDVASHLAARGDDVMLTDARHPLGRHIAAVAIRRAAGALPPLAAEPLYIDLPEARPRAVAVDAIPA